MYKEGEELIGTSDSAWDADKLYVIDSATKEIRGNTTMYCDTSGTWRYSKNDAEVTGTPIMPNDMLILVSGVRPSGAPSPWTWTYAPGDFYKFPTRHMGREHLRQTGTEP